MPELYGGNLLRQRRKEKKLTQKATGELVGYSEECIASVERGARNASVRLAKALGTALEFDYRLLLPVYYEDIS